MCTSEGAVVSTEMLVKLTRMGIPFVEIPVQHLPRLHGKATGAKLRVIVRAFGELLRLRSKLSAWAATELLAAGGNRRAWIPANVTWLACVVGVRGTA